MDESGPSKPVVNLLHEFLIRSAQRLPHKTALVAEPLELSYETLLRKATNLAACLVKQGFARGDRVVIYLENSAECVVSIYGTLLAGGVFSVINPTVKAGKLLHILQNCRPTFCITESKKLSVLDGLRLDGQRPQIIVTGNESNGRMSFETIVQADATIPALRQVDLDLAAIIYTSGSTGDPKGVTLTHRNMVTAVNSITTYLENAESDVVLSVLPLSFDYGLYQALMTIAFGGTLILKKRFGYPFQLLKEIHEKRITGLPCVPTMMAILLRMDKPADLDLSCVRYISNTGAALPPAYFPRLAQLFPQARIFSMYGLTECKRVSYLPPHLINERPESVGIPMPNTEVFVIDSEGRWQNRDATGELIVRGSTVMQGYYGDPEATAAVLTTGRYPWEKVLHTGDLFRIDKDGFLYFLGRMDDLIKTCGERVAPKEIENALYEIDDVLAAGVSPVPDEVMGNALKAEIVLKKGSDVTSADILRHCRATLEDLFVPKYVDIVSSLPQSASGKIERTPR